MSLRAILLITLQQEPGTGYDILQRFKAGLAHVWQASHQQLYRELDRMRGDGLLTCETVPQAERPDRKVYHLTAAGGEALDTWLAEPLAAGPVREPLFAKFFAWERWPADARRRELGDLHEQLTQRLATYAAIEEEWFAAPERLTPAQRAPWHTLRLGQRLTQTWREWIEEVLEEGE
ncbi:PadR family transcriptional regulator [Billgrantia gudaonensis]|uniref:PadR family transcriptional regulator, regulatory protein AphA n=1 Tax=Billgrantia gudaonensis TaxID=376427 RepID=A0A1G8N730_9GAMM|nr:PadR family transcriptional regulator [Halomonas gudaonensis]SDI76099.1 PadR family transcriptional regulator, regulatory protein AphA [Halomonas gudaonensis]